MKLNKAPGCAVALAFAAGFTSYTEAFHVPVPSTAATTAARLLSPAGCGPSCSRVAGARDVRGAVGPHAVECRCGACAAVVLRGVLGGRAKRRGHVVSSGAEGGEGVVAAGFDLDDKTTEELWARPRKHLISVGKAGVKSSHVRSLNALVKAHTLVKVKINIPGADLQEVGLQLCREADILGEEGEEASPTSGKEEAVVPTGVSFVTSRPKQNMILFAKTEYLTSLAKGEVFSNQ